MTDLTDDAIKWLGQAADPEATGWSPLTVEYAVALKAHIDHLVTENAALKDTNRSLHRRTQQAESEAERKAWAKVFRPGTWESHLVAENAELRATVEGDAELLARVGRRLKRLATGPSDDGLGDECVARAALTDARIRAALDGGGEMGEGGDE